MTDQLTSFETVKLATEKGFDIITRYGNEASLYDKHGHHTYYMNYGVMYSGLGDGYIPAPTQSLLQKWLREIHNIHIGVRQDVLTLKWRVDFVTMKQDYKMMDVVWEEKETYEEALEDGLKAALDLV
jgi:hypothetical protein